MNMEGRMSESSSRICQLLMIHMTGGAPFGFRIASIHSDGISPFAVSTIRINGKAYRAGLLEADLVLAINGFNCCNGLSHHSATRLMEYDDPELTLHILRGENLCEGDIKTSLQSLDSQIVELTDNEVQSVIAKKQAQQPVGVPVWKSKLTNSLSHLSVLSPSWLQPPPKARPKMVERRNDMLSLSQMAAEPPNSIPNESTDDRGVHQTKVETKANDDMTACLTTAQLRINEATECNRAFQLSDKPIGELKSKHLDCVSIQKYQLNDAEQQSRWNELPNSLTIDETNDKITFQSKPTTGHFDMASPLNKSDRSIDDRAEREGQTSLSKQQLKHNNNHLRNRYRVEQNFVFKPVDQARHYDAESGQFRENSSDKPPKRRSNSISCYHMYIGSGILKPSSVVENNRRHFQKPEECNRWKPREENCKQFDGTVYQWANGTINDPVTDFNQGVSNSQSRPTSTEASSPGKSNISMSPSVNLSQQCYPTMRPSHNAANSISHWSSNRPIQLATPTKQLQASSNKWETRSLHRSSPVSPFSPASGDLPLLSPNSPHCMPKSMTKLVPAYMDVLLHEAPPESILGTSRALPKLISLRSNEDEAHSPSTVHRHFLPFNETALVKVKSPQHYSDMTSVNYDAHMHSLSKYQNTPTLGLDTNRQLTQPEKFSEPQPPYHSAHKPNSSISETCPVNANSDSLKTFLANEGKGGRLFARRRANSDAWIVGERDEPSKTAAKSVISDRNIIGMQAMAEPNGMQRRRSLAAAHLQQPVHNEIGNNSHQYRSRTAEKLVNSFSSPRPFNEIQHTNIPYCQSQSSTGHKGVNHGGVRRQLDLNSWHLQGTTDQPISPSISQRFRPLQADPHPICQHATEANQHTLGYTDL